MFLKLVHRRKLTQPDYSNYFILDESICGTGQAISLLQHLYQLGKIIILMDQTIRRLFSISNTGRNEQRRREAQKMLAFMLLGPKSYEEEVLTQEQLEDPQLKIINTEEFSGEYFMVLKQVYDQYTNATIVTANYAFACVAKSLKVNILFLVSKNKEDSPDEPDFTIDAVVLDDNGNAMFQTVKKQYFHNLLIRLPEGEQLPSQVSPQPDGEYQLQKGDIICQIKKPRSGSVKVIIAQFLLPQTGSNAKRIGVYYLSSLEEIKKVPHAYRNLVQEFFNSMIPYQQITVS